jgi:hypothetical protein
MGLEPKLFINDILKFEKILKKYFHIGNEVYYKNLSPKYIVLWARKKDKMCQGLKVIFTNLDLLFFCFLCRVDYNIF